MEVAPSPPAPETEAKKEVPASSKYAFLRSAFDLFDTSSNGTVDVREIGTILRSLGVCPSKAEIDNYAMQVDDI